MSNCKRILYIHGGILLRGGAEAYMMNYYRHFDHEKLQVDFVVHGLEKGVYDDEIEAMGGKIYRVPTKSQNLKGNLSGLQRIFSSGEYQLVHSHMDTMNVLVLMLAKKCGIPVRISHSHSTFLQTSNKIKIWVYEKIKKVYFLKEEFSVLNGMLTGTLKIKYKKVCNTYQKEIDSLYKER